jgi:hypothetical protein
VSHANAALAPRARLRLARLIVDEGWPVARAAERYDVSWPTAKRWADRYRQAGPAGMADRSSRPHHSPRRTPAPVVRRIVHLRLKQRLGPVQIADRVGVAPSTVHAVLTLCRLNRLSHLDRHTGEPVRRYEHDRPGALLHVDVKKLGNLPDGGGWRFVGRAQGDRHRAATPGKPRNRHHNPKMGTAFVHTVSGDHSRIAYAEIHDDETATTATAVLRRARHHPEVHPPLPAADQREDRAVPPHPRPGLGLPAAPRHRDAPPQGPTRLAPRVQPPPAPHRHRRTPTHHPLDQPVRSAQLAGSPAAQSAGSTAAAGRRPGRRHRGVRGCRPGHGPPARRLAPRPAVLATGACATPVTADRTAAASVLDRSVC